MLIENAVKFCVNTWLCKAGDELSRNLPAILCFHNFMMIPLHLSTFQ